MKHPLLRALLAAPALLFCTASAADAPAKNPAKRDYVRYVGDDKRGKLETVIVTMKKDGVQVELVGAVHIADPSYYQALTKLFTGYEELLFELVDGQRLKQGAEGSGKTDAPKKPRAPLKQGEFPPDDEEPAPKD